MDYLIIAFRTIISYTVLILALRIMGKREIGQLNLFDLIILLSIADVMVISIEDYNVNFFKILLPVALLTFLQKVAALILLKNAKTREIIDGKPSVVILNGKLQVKEMKKQSYNMDDLLMQLRTQNIFNIEDVNFAVLETSGKLSVMENSNINNKYIMPIIVSGSFDKEILILYQINEQKISTILGNNQIAIKDILCAYYDENSIKLILKDGTNKKIK